MNESSPNINYFWSQLMIEELVRCGVTQFCIAPGSRSTPLTWAAAEHPKAQTHVHFDERGLAFLALGLAKASNEPVVLICTSGTAVANFLPAVVEASQSHIPLILLTADRPPELIDTGANQAIIQPGIFSHYVRWETQLSTPDENISPNYVLTSVDQAVHKSQSPNPGPVHVNCPYREPLAPDDPPHFPQMEKRFAAWETTSYPFTTYEIETDATTTLDSIVPIIENSSKGLIIAGQMSLTESKALVKVAEQLNWSVVPDCTSHLRFGNQSAQILTYADLMLTDSDSPLHDWECVVQFGGPFVSKRLQQALEKHPPRHFIRVAPHTDRQDPGHQFTHRFICSVTAFEKGLKLISSSPDADWYETCQQINHSMAKFLEESNALKETTEPGAIRRVIQKCPDQSVLMLGSSMPIRDADMYGTTTANSLEVTANRGASGIDGTIATAVGYSLAKNTAATLIVGDLTALHDLNSLALVDELKHPFVIVVINNQGGGIFSMLPIEKYKKNFEPYWGTPHSFQFQKFAESFGLEYANPQSLNELETCYSQAIVSNRGTLIEIQTNRDENRLVHENLIKELQ
jgi:2-succinyl-5-enolpyruvyl-6-hydroxy-3-cyclohexene-1-carboxylate synthase